MNKKNGVGARIHAPKKSRHVVVRNPKALGRNHLDEKTIVC